MHIEFANKRVLVIGAARGIGRAIVQAFAERGGDVWAGDLLETDIAPLAGPRGNGGAVHAGRIVVTDPASIENFVAEAAGDGAVDVLV